MENALVEIPLAGGQIRFPVPIKPATLPAIFRELPTEVERRRAKDAWNAALRLEVLIDLWVRFLTCGMLRWRLADETEINTIERFPELDSFGTVLNMFAAQVDLPAEGRNALTAAEQECRITRGPTSRHLQDSPQKAGRAVQGFLRAFQKLMLIEAGCLHRLDINSDCFRRPWEVVRSEVEQMICVDGDWSGNTVVLDFGDALRSSALLRVGGAWRKALTELVELLQQYPTAVLARSEGLSPVVVANKRTKAGLTRDEADRRTAEHLSSNPTAKSEGIAKAIGCSGGLVRGTPAWKGRKLRTPKAPANPSRWRGGKAVGLEIGLEREAERRFKDESVPADAPDDGNEDVECETPMSREDQLETLEREQRRDMRQKRVPRGS